MQKFRSNDFKSIYEDVHMAPGFTHNPFAGVKDNGYGWHQYYSDTDCIWMAIEYRPALFASYSAIFGKYRAGYFKEAVRKTNLVTSYMSLLVFFFSHLQTW